MIKELQLRILPKTAAQSDLLKAYLADEYAIRKDDIKAVRILKRSIDARQRQVFVNLKVRVYINEEPTDDEFVSIDYKPVSGKRQAIVVGAGPAGLFAALRLIEHDIRPIVIERGKNVRDRKKDIANISREGYVDPESNYSFGEGGAGAYSDGKLYTRSKKRGSVDRILNIFCQHGASTAILADAHPHIGTDRLPRVIENMRNTILRCGGEVHFQTKMVELLLEEPKSRSFGGSESRNLGVSGIIARDLVTGTEHEFLGPVILATGHSARDVYRYLYTSNIYIEPKSLAVGVRLEHPSHLIDQIQYHSRDGRGKYLPAAEYSFVTQVEGRGVYSFCMCPGGFVVPAASGPEQLVVNGMSPSSRGGKWSNSGMVVEVTQDSITLETSKSRNLETSKNPLIMLEFQEQLERLCYTNKGEKLSAPAQRMADFVNNRLSADLPATSYSPGIVSSPLHFWMPKEIRSRLQTAFKEFGRKSHGFLTNEAIIIGMETRTSAPVRIVRDSETLQHVELQGLYPAGEGAGYAGGIVSAAIDGERCADALANYELRIMN